MQWNVFGSFQQVFAYLVGADGTNPVTTGNPLPVKLSATPTIDIGEITINSNNPSIYQEVTQTTGTTAQNLFAGATPINGFEISNPSYNSEPVYWREAGVATIGTNFSNAVQPGQVYTSPLSYLPSGAISVNCATTGHKFTARSW